MDGFTVRPIQSAETQEWYLKKHYAHRCPPIMYAFGLFNKDMVLSGVLSYGRPVAHHLILNAFAGKYMDTFLELNRLVVNEGLGKNVLSFFVSTSLKMLPSPMVLVSYADTAQGHHGYIYQATNWIYTGLSQKFKDYMIKGMEHLHSASIMCLAGRADNGIEYEEGKVERLKKEYGAENIYMIDRPQKHRYFYFLGTKKQVKEMRANLKYEVLPYPKGENKRYDASYAPPTQSVLF